MIKKNDKEIVGVYKGATEISAVYKGLVLVYQNAKTMIAEGVPPITVLNALEKVLLGYRIYGNSKQGELPDGYIKLEYIEATGEQYIDTGFSPDANTQVDYKVRFRQDAEVASPLMGARVGSINTARFFPIAYNNPNTEFRTAFGSAQQAGMSINFNIDYEGSFQPQNEVSIINGTSYSLSGNNFAKTNNYNMYLFATPGYTDNLYLSKGVIYYVKVYQSGTLVRNLIPAKNSSGTIGMYDLVTNTFLTNQGTGTFTAGAEMPNPDSPIEIQSVGDNEIGLPLGYTQLDYVEGDGTQNINTTFIPNQDTKVELDIQLLSASGALFGSREAVQSRGFTIQALSAGKFGGTYGNQNRESSMDYDYLRHTHILDKNKYYVDGNLVYTYSTATFTCPGNAYIFNMYNNSSPSTGNKARLYGCKIWDNGTLVRNFIPCKNQNSIAGVYDTVNKQFYLSSGTENFISGNEIAKGGYKIPVSVSGKNKYDISKSVLGGLSSANGSEITSTTRVRTDYIKIDNTYSVSIDENDNYSIVNIYYYDGNKNYAGYSNLNTGGRLREYTGTVTSGTKYIRPVFCVYNSTSTDVDLTAFKQSKIQIEESSTVTAYEEYFNRTENIYLDEPLRKIGNADVVKLPDGYTQLEYIESTGTQYIDTNYIPNSKTKIQANVAFTEDTSSLQQFGAIANLGTSSRVNYARWHFGVFSNKLCVFRENTTQSGDIRLDYDDDFHIYEITNTSCSLDDTTKDVTLYTNSNVSFTLFARNGYTTAGDTASISAYSKSKLKSFKIYEDNVLIRNYIPCINDQNVLGLYDVVNDIFYSNDGNGVFTAGPVVYADYIDFETQKVIRNVRELVITGDEEWSFANTIARFTIANSQLSATGIDYTDQLCNYFKCDLITTGGTTKGASVYYSSSLGGTLFRVRDDALTSATVAKNFFKGLYDSGKPCKIYYQSVAPTEESVELPEILLNKGKNVIEVDTTITPSDMWIKYKGK